MKLYSVMEVSRILHISKDKVYGLIYSGKLKAILVPGTKRGLKVTEQALNEFLQEAEQFK